MWNCAVQGAQGSCHTLQILDAVPAVQDRVGLRFWQFVLMFPKWRNRYSGSSALAFETFCPFTSVQRSLSWKPDPGLMAGAPAQLQERPPALPRNKKGRDICSLQWAHILRMVRGSSLLTHAVLDCPQSGLGGLLGTPCDSKQQSRRGLGRGVTMAIAPLCDAEIRYQLARY